MHVSSKCSIAVHCLIYISEYGAEEKVTGKVLAHSTGVNSTTIRIILSSLKKNGIITEKSDFGGVVLAQNAKDISLYDIYKAADKNFLDNIVGVHPSPSQECPVGRNIYTVLDKTYYYVRAALEINLKKISLAWIISKHHATIKSETTNA